MSTHTVTHSNQAGRSAWLEISLGAICDNVRRIRDWVGPEVRVVAVVKANAYGHGLVESARAALAGGAGMLAVAIPAEAATLRRAGIRAPVLVMGGCVPEDAPLVVAANAQVACATPEFLDALRGAAVRAGATAPVHLKVDTGMGRLGVDVTEVGAWAQRIAAAGPFLSLAGLFTHFATADEEEQGPTRAQLAAFRTAVEAVCRETNAPIVVHAANSPGIVRIREAFAAENWPGVRIAVRPGLLIYGVPAVPGGPDVRPALSLKARVTQARDVPAGRAISYGGTFTTKRPSRLALVPLGYADGYSRANSNRAFVLLRGRRVPVAGRVCMDQFVVDATDTGAEVGDEVVLIGRQGDDEITVNELAGWGGTVHHEVLARLGERLPRVYPDAETCLTPENTNL
jgi:alanine racemase